MRERSWSRLVAGLLVWLAIGATLSVLVAWGLVVRAYYSGWTIGPTSRAEPSDWPFNVPPEWPEKADEATDVSAFGCTLRHRYHVGTERGDGYRAHSETAGLPLRSLSSSWSLWVPKGVPDVVGKAPGADRDGAVHPRLDWRVPLTLPGKGEIDLPAQPVWPGFVFNTLFYAVLCRALWQVPLALRRRRRRRLGRCSVCGYDQSDLPAGTPCPECGGPAGRVPVASHPGRPTAIS
jgi:hypothetical protein